MRPIIIFPLSHSLDLSPILFGSLYPLTDSFSNFQTQSTNRIARSKHRSIKSHIPQTHTSDSFTLPHSHLLPNIHQSIIHLRIDHSVLIDRKCTSPSLVSKLVYSGRLFSTSLLLPTISTHPSTRQSINEQPPLPGCSPNLKDPQSITLYLAPLYSKPPSLTCSFQGVRLCQSACSQKKLTEF